MLTKCYSEGQDLNIAHRMQMITLGEVLCLGFLIVTIAGNGFSIYKNCKVDGTQSEQRAKCPKLKSGERADCFPSQGLNASMQRRQLFEFCICFFQ